MWTFLIILLIAAMPMILAFGFIKLSSLKNTPAAGTEQQSLTPPTVGKVQASQGKRKIIIFFIITFAIGAFICIRKEDDCSFDKMTLQLFKVIFKLLSALSK